ncbi:ribonuclease Z [Candidatus Micrarchaeota archaeon]|nr:ribonuclease Z [Candidatus Micrarchaeota archaeon]
MIRLVCLGTSASTPTSRHVPSHFAVKFGGVFLLDCAEGCQRQMMKFGVPYGSLSGVFLTHLHADHVLGLPGVIQTLNLADRKAVLPIFGPAGTRDFVETLLDLPSLRAKFPVTVTEMPHTQTASCLKTTLFEVRSFPVQHSSKAVGYVMEEAEKTKFHEDQAKSKGIQGRLFTQIQEMGELTVKGKKIRLEDVTFKQAGKKLAFTGDTQACRSTQENAENADVLVHDCTFLEEHKDLADQTKHATALSAATLAKKAHVKKLILTHLGNRYANRNVLLDEAQRVFPATELAQEGKEWLI